MIATSAFRAVHVRASAASRSAARRPVAPLATLASAPASGLATSRAHIPASTRRVACRATEETEVELDKELSKSVRKIASTFAPRGSGDAAGKKNPAFKGSTLYTIFEVQAYVSLVVGALLSYNVLLPSDEPNIARLMGMWSVWMFAVPSLRARECDPKEKDALNLLFVAIPLVNVLIPIVWKSIPAVFTADCVLMACAYFNKAAGIFDEDREIQKTDEA